MVDDGWLNGTEKERRVWRRRGDGEMGRPGEEETLRRGAEATGGRRPAPSSSHEAGMPHGEDAVELKDGRL